MKANQFCPRCQKIHLNNFFGSSNSMKQPFRKKWQGFACFSTIGWTTKCSLMCSFCCNILIHCGTCCCRYGIPEKRRPLIGKFHCWPQTVKLSSHWTLTELVFFKHCLIFIMRYFMKDFATLILGHGATSHLRRSSAVLQASTASGWCGKQKDWSSNGVCKALSSTTESYRNLHAGT